MFSLARIWSMIRIGVRGHILNPPWRERAARRRARVNVLATEVPRYLKRYLPAAANVPMTVPVKNDKSEKAFSIWLQGRDNAPELVKSCYRGMERNLKQKLVVLDEKTLFDYIDLPGVIMDKRNSGKIANAHFADIARVELLHNHGGIWLDATDFVTGPITKEIIDQDFFVFLTSGNYGSPYSFIQNCFIRARKNSYLLNAWRAMILEFWKKEPKNYDYFMHQLMFKTLVQNDPRAMELFEKMPKLNQDPTHELWRHRNEPFDKKLFDEITSKAFFQKLTYRGTDNVIPGSFADAIIKM